MPVILRANLTPIPKGMDTKTNERIVLLHISFIKLDTGGSGDPVPMKLSFEDLPLLKEFMKGPGSAPLQLVSKQGENMVDIGSFKAPTIDMRCWDAMNYKAQQKLKTFFDYKADLAGTEAKVNNRKKELDRLITASDKEQKRLNRIIDIETGNLKVYSGILDDLLAAEKVFSAEREHVPDEGLKTQLAELQRRRTRYSSEQTVVQSSMEQHTTALAKEIKLYNEYVAEQQRAKDAATVLQYFKEHKFIPTDQDNAIDYILGNASPPVKSAVASHYTSDVKGDDALSLTDVMGYFSSFPAYQNAMGLHRTVRVAADKLGAEGILEVRYDVNSPQGIECVGHQVAYEHQADGFFFPKSGPDGGDRYMSGYLNLLMKTKENGPENEAFELLQNSYEEIRYRDTANEAGTAESDYTNGFFLIQRDAASTLKYKAPNGVLHLEDLLQGYRVDVSRNDGAWHSLHRRSYHLHIKGQDVAGDDDDEGFISANSATKAFELVLVTNADKMLTDVNLNEISKDTLELPVSLLPNVRQISLKIRLSDKMDFSIGANGAYDLAVLTLDKKAEALTGDALDAFVGRVNKLFHDTSAEFVHRSLGCDLRGRLYYKSLGKYLNSKEDEMPSFLSSSLICHINGHSLSAPGYVGKEIQDFYNRPVKGDLQHLGAFLQYAGISLDMKQQKNTLPLLRIGDSHAVRCRLVLVGGVSLPPGHMEKKYTRSKSLLRQDPIGAPRLLLPKTYDPRAGGVLAKNRALGDSETQIIIRGNVDEAVKTTRVIAPPSVNWQLAEWSKMMDVNDYPDATIMRETATSNKMPQYTILPEKKNKVQVVEWKKGTGKFETYVDAGAAIPYIIDPMAAYFVIEPVRLYSVDTAENIFFNSIEDIKNKVKTAYDSQLKALTEIFDRKFFTPGKEPTCGFWDYKTPDKRKANDGSLRCWTLEIKAGDTTTGINIDQERRAVVIALKPGDDIEFAIRSFTKDGVQLNSLYYGRDAHESLQKGQPAGGKTAVLAEKRFRAIYAVQKPSQNPHLAERSTAGSGGDGNAQFQVDRLAKHPLDVLIYQTILSVGRVCKDVFLAATWEEILDDVPDDEIDRTGSPLRIARHYKKVFSYFDKGYYAFGDNTVNVQGREFGAEKSPSPFVWEAKADSRELDLNPGKEDKTFRLYVNMRGKYLAFKHGIGSNKAMLARYRMGGTSRFDVYFQEGKDAKKADLFSAEDTQWFGNVKDRYDFLLMATEAPQSPKIYSMTPLFDTKGEHDKVFKGIRVHLERPWYTSGYAEQLAVIAETDPQDAEAAAQYVTQVGRDSLQKEPGLQGRTIFSTIPKRYPYTIPGSGKKINVKIASFPVLFDKRNKRWYSDILIESQNIANAYCPFVRLVIARYQPNAVEGKELSLPVACDFFQVYPGRTVKMGGSNGTRITINTPGIRIGYDDQGKIAPLTQLLYWKIGEKNAMAPLLQGYRFDDVQLLPEPEKAHYDGNGQFTLDYGNAPVKAIIVKEFELYTNSNDDIRTKRLLYSYVIPINNG